MKFQVAGYNEVVSANQSASPAKIDPLFHSVPTHKMVKYTQTICRQKPTNYLSVFDHFVGLALIGLRNIRSNVLRLFLKKLTLLIQENLTKTMRVGHILKENDFLTSGLSSDIH